MGAGISASTVINNSKQTAYNSVVQESTANCSATCTEIQSGQVIILENSKTGDINFNQQCTADASCTIDNQLTSLAKTIFEASQKGEASPTLGFFGIQANTVVNMSEQDIKNLISQKITSICEADVYQIQQNQFIYAKNSTTGDIGFSQNGDATANCIMNNLAESTVDNKAVSDQVATAGGLGLGAIIALIVIVLIVMGVLAFVMRKRGGSGGGNTNQPSRPPPLPPRNK